MFNAIIFPFSRIKLMQSTTVYPKAHLSHYASDGTGRDTYINFNNGGLYRGFNLHSKQKFSRGGMERYTEFRKPSRTIAGMPIHYPSDGTGRDTYIIVDEGGLGLVEPRRRNFLSSLRNYSNKNRYPQTDILMSAQLPCSPYNRPSLKLLNISQSELSKKLSQPRITEDPYKQLRTSFRKSLGKGSLTSRASSTPRRF